MGNFRVIDLSIMPPRVDLISYHDLFEFKAQIALIFGKAKCKLGVVSQFTCLSLCCTLKLVERAGALTTVFKGLQFSQTQIRTLKITFHLSFEALWCSSLKCDFTVGGHFQCFTHTFDS